MEENRTRLRWKLGSGSVIAIIVMVGLCLSPVAVVLLGSGDVRWVIAAVFAAMTWPVTCWIAFVALRTKQLPTIGARYSRR